MDKEADEKTEQAIKIEPDSNWKHSYIVFLILPFVSIVLVPLGGLLYLFGRLSRHPYLVACMIYPLTGLLIIYCLAGSIRRLCGGWRNRSEKRKLIIAAEIGLPVLFIVSFLVPFFVSERSNLRFAAKAFTYGFRVPLKIGFSS